MEWESRDPACKFYSLHCFDMCSYEPVQLVVMLRYTIKREKCKNRSCCHRRHQKLLVQFPLESTSKLERFASAGKMLPPFSGEDSSEIGTESTLAPSESPSRAPSQSFASSIAEGSAVLEEADRYFL